MSFPGGAAAESQPAMRRPKRRGRGPWVGKVPWRQAGQPTPAFLPGKSHGQRSLAGRSPWGRSFGHSRAQRHWQSAGPGCHSIGTTDAGGGSGPGKAAWGKQAGQHGCWRSGGTRARQTGPRSTEKGRAAGPGPEGFLPESGRQASQVPLPTPPAHRVPQPAAGGFLLPCHGGPSWLRLFLRLPAGQEGPRGELVHNVPTQPALCPLPCQADRGTPPLRAQERLAELTGTQGSARAPSVVTAVGEPHGWSPPLWLPKPPHCQELPRGAVSPC